MKIIVILIILTFSFNSFSAPDLLQEKKQTNIKNSEILQSEAPDEDNLLTKLESLEIKSTELLASVPSFYTINEEANTEITILLKEAKKLKSEIEFLSQSLLDGADIITIDVTSIQNQLDIIASKLNAFSKLTAKSSIVNLRLEADTDPNSIEENKVYTLETQTKETIKVLFGESLVSDFIHSKDNKDVVAKSKLVKTLKENNVLIGNDKQIFSLTLTPLNQLSVIRLGGYIKNGILNLVHIDRNYIKESNETFNKAIRTVLEKKLESENKQNTKNNSI